MRFTSGDATLDTQISPGTVFQRIETLDAFRIAAYLTGTFTTAWFRNIFSYLKYITKN